MEQTVFVDSTGQSHVLNLRFHRESRTKYRAKSVDDLKNVPEFRSCLIMPEGIITVFLKLEGVRIKRCPTNVPSTTMDA